MHYRLVSTRLLREVNLKLIEVNDSSKGYRFSYLSYLVKGIQSIQRPSLAHILEFLTT